MDQTSPSSSQSPPNELGGDEWDPLDLGVEERRQRKLPKALRVEVVRSLGADDLPLLSRTTPTLPQGIQRLRNAHHQLARLCALGTPLAEMALITGYSPSYISKISNEDPGFMDLVGHYRASDTQEFQDTLGRMETVGLTALEILQERLTENPDGFSNRELLEVEEVNLVKPHQGNSRVPSLSGPPGGLSVNVNFVTPKAAKPIVTIEGEPAGADRD